MCNDRANSGSDSAVADIGLAGTLIELAIWNWSGECKTLGSREYRCPVWTAIPHHRRYIDRKGERKLRETSSAGG